MATIDDFGDTAEPLNNPVLGGPAGWAAAVRDALNGKLARSGEQSLNLNSPAGPAAVNFPDAGGSIGGDGASDRICVWNADKSGFKPLSVGNPTLSTEAATKSYVDGGSLVTLPANLLANWADMGYPWALAYRRVGKCIAGFGLFSWVGPASTIPENTFAQLGTLPAELAPPASMMCATRAYTPSIGEIDCRFDFRADGQYGIYARLGGHPLEANSWIALPTFWVTI